MYQNGDLRYIRLRGREILRRVYIAVRDHNWGTVPVVISDLGIEKSDCTFRMHYEGDNRQEEIHFHWWADITGDEHGTITLTMQGKALSSFLRNRIGFCVLHPIRECAGLPCTVEHDDGTMTHGSFPRYIAPQQPFREMQAICHEVLPGLQAEIRFSGDIFEMEDQRNWCDASFKTYCTPLRLPYPVRLEAGETIAQAVRLTLKGRVPVVADNGPDRERVTFSFNKSAAKPLPNVGLAVSSNGKRLTDRELARLCALNLSHLRVDLNLLDGEFMETFHRAAADADSLGVPLELALTLSEVGEAELSKLLAGLRKVKPSVCRWLVFQVSETSTSGRWVKLARKYLCQYDPKAKIISGTNFYFAELNRGRPPIDLVDGVCFSINPQVHATDNQSLVENLEAQAWALESTRQFTSSVPIVITPITLKPRFNPVTAGPERHLGIGELPTQVDPRQMSLFGAAWTLVSLKHVSQGGAASVTYYETTGWLGVMETDGGSALPEKFPSIPGCVFPLYQVLAHLPGFTDVLMSSSSDPLRVDGIALRKGNQLRLILANLTGELQAVATRVPSESTKVRFLDETNAEDAMLSPQFGQVGGNPVRAPAGGIELELRPFGLAWIDVGAR
jgi:hypothetical protein